MAMTPRPETPASITTQETSGATVVTVHGRLTLGAETNDLREHVKALLAAGKKKLVLDLAEVSYIDSSGLGTLVSLFTSATSAGAQLKLVQVSGRLHELLVTTKLLTVFDIYADAAAAVASFSASVAAV
jgi:anti-sigma B factor antagonist